MFNSERSTDPQGRERKPVLRIKDLYKSFGSTPVIKGINLTVTEGEVVCIIGPSGTGKSTLLRTINNLEPIQSGEIRINDQLIGYKSDSAERKPINGWAAARQRRNVGMVFQDFNLFWHMTLIQNIMLGPTRILRKGRKEATAQAHELLDLVGLRDKADAYPQSLSGGQQQRGAIARALAMEPALLLFDEPTSALDPDMTAEVVRTTERLADRNMTMIIVSHEMSFVKNVASRVIMMNQGVITDDVTDLNSTKLSTEIRRYMDMDH